MDIEKKIAFLESNLKRQLTWIAAADAKLPPYLALATAMLGILAALAPCLSQMTIVSLIFTIASVSLLIATLIMLSIAAFPRIKGPHGSMVYFGGICERTLSQFKKDINEFSFDIYRDDLVKQCHRNAYIARRKYCWVRWAVCCLFASLPFWIVTIYVFYRLR